MKHLLLATAALACAAAPLLAQTATPTEGDTATATQAKKYEPWGFDLSARDMAVKPGDDFDNYANGGWAKRTEIPGDQPSAGVGYDVFNLSQVQLRSLIEAAPATSLIGGLYKSFMDEARVDALGARPLAADLAKIAAVKDKAGFARLNGAQSAGFGLPLFSPFVYSDPNRPGINTFYIGQAGIGLPERDYYLKPDFQPQRTAYRAYIERALAMAGYPTPAAHADAIMAFETEIAKVSWAAADRRDLDKTNNPMTVAELKKLAPGFAWKEFLAGAMVGDPGTMIVQEKSAFPAIAAIFDKTPLDTLKAWNAFHTIYQASPYLAKTFVDSRFEFVRSLSGVSAQRPRWKRGTTLVDQSLGEELGRAYVERYFPASSKQEMEELVGNLKLAMGDRITAAPWMSAATKKEALAKLNAMKVMVGYPDKWRDYSKLKIDAADLYGNVERSHAFEWAYTLTDLNKPVDGGKWLMTPQTVNAYNGGEENKIVFPAGILQPPFFNPKADPAVNYGSIGAVIGHEISHGFDDQGRKIDATGKVRDWWTPEDAKRFDAQADIFGKQYDSYEPVAGTHVNGKLTMGENIADLAGLAVAHDAYLRSLGGKPAPVIDGLTGDQRFFLAFAQSWRDKQRDDAIRQQVASDPHTPSRFRVIGPVRDLDAWYAAFGVKPGDKYYVAPADRPRIW
ncbi:M13 family metallopeptidase [Sphingomonas naphthae]|uniref:M13 family metallopeptidase n=1 Tax=Sphingomonas naphthae TaxID=1813468 RepID=A0ABY7TGT9_9SPHN|nr:M13 family metallopeptidase [Sphingomonas naphthae]WCT71937.1 M13 family metallopeptidase [Sphingomonas naphthae]